MGFVSVSPPGLIADITGYDPLVRLLAEAEAEGVKLEQ